MNKMAFQIEMNEADDLLDYEKEMFLNLHHGSGLLVCSRGLGIERIFRNYIKLYSDPQCLVLVLNSSPEEAKYYIESVIQDPVVSVAPRLVNADISLNERIKTYRQGGVVFISSRILVVDLLSDRVPVSLVTGILLLKAHQTLESCQEAFILRLFRERNTTGFVKAFSEQPSALIAGFNHVYRLMIACQARQLHVWPRFHASVQNCLRENPPNVEEVRVALTSSMIACQRALLDLMNACLKELGRTNAFLDMDELTIENALTRNFQRLVRRYLDPVWHRLNGHSQRLVSDLTTLRRLIAALTQVDAVTFYAMLSNLKASQAAFGRNSGWLFYDEADHLYKNARDRVFGSKSTSEDETINKTEIYPKWLALKQVLDDLKGGDEISKTLIVVEDEKTASVLADLLDVGAEEVLCRLRSKFFPDSKPAKPAKASSSKTKKKVTKEPEQPTLTQILKPESDADAAEDSPAAASSGVFFYHLHPTSLAPRSPRDKLPHVLQELKPQHVVLYDTDIASVRQLEVFQACQRESRVNVFVFVYADSVEEQRYLTTLRKEKESFEYLIAEKSSLVLPEDLLNAWDGVEDQSQESKLTTRKAGGQQPASGSAEAPRIIVDMREFRSSLPSLIHRKGIRVVPQTIEIGDYILTADICIERKSVDDLIGSLNSGRLYNQCVAMTRTYARPTLLVEFDSNKAFSLYGGGHKYASLSKEFSSNDALSKLVLLTLHFPALRFVWTPSPYATAEIFTELKEGYLEPPMIVDNAEVKESSENQSWLNCRARDMFLALPGVTEKNYRALMKHANCLLDLCNLGEEELGLILSSTEAARRLYRFLHADKRSAVTRQQAGKAKFGRFREARKGKEKRG